MLGSLNPFSSISNIFDAVIKLIQGDPVDAGLSLIGADSDKLEGMAKAFSEFDRLLNGQTLVTTVMYPEVSLDGTGTTYSDLFGMIYNFVLGTAIALIVLKVAYKAFQTYVLGDNDPSADPIILFKKMMQAFIVAVSFNSILYYILYSFVAVFVKGITGMIYNSYVDGLLGDGQTIQMGQLILNIMSNSASFMTNPLNTIFIIIWVISFIILYVKFIMRSVELLYLRIGFPIACVGIIDSDYGVFKPFVKKFFQASISIIIQVALLYLSIGIIALPLFDSEASSGILNTIFGCCFLWTAFSVPKVLQEFLLWGGSGNGASTMINMGANLTRTITTFIK